MATFSYNLVEGSFIRRKPSEVVVLDRMIESLEEVARD
jgi:hypothetical protein